MKSKNCSFCPSKATYIRTTTSTHYAPYGNPYLPAKYYEITSTSSVYACDIHFEESTKLAILGPYHWVKL